MTDPKGEDWSSLFVSMDETARRAFLLKQLQELDSRAACSSTSLRPALGLEVPEAVDPTKQCLDTTSSDVDSFVLNSQRHLTYESQGS